MPIPEKTIDRLFARLSATYGSELVNKWGVTPIEDVKAAWAHELDGFERHLHALAWALENLPERAPNVLEFRNLCRRAPAPETKRLPEPVADPARVKAELVKLSANRSAQRQDPKDWARRIISRHDAGERVHICTLQMARQALRLVQTPEAA